MRRSVVSHAVFGIVCVAIVGWVAAFVSFVSMLVSFAVAGWQAVEEIRAEFGEGLAKGIYDSSHALWVTLVSIGLILLLVSTGLVPRRRWVFADYVLLASFVAGVVVAIGSFSTSSR